MKKKICCVIDSLRPGGAERVIVSLANGFCNFENDVCLIAVSESQDVSFFHIDSKVKVILLGKLNNKNSKIRKILALRKIIKNEKPNVVISFLPHISMYVHLAITGLKSKHIPSLRSDPNRDISNPIKSFFRKLCYSKSSGCVFQTEEAKCFFSKAIQKKSVVIPNPINSEIHFNSEQNFKNIIVSAGRYIESKNHLLLLKSFFVFRQSHPEYKLIIYGDGPLKQKYIEFVLKNNLENSVIFQEPSILWFEEVKNARMFVLTSDYEGMPNALMEAMAVGIPSISTDCSIGGPRSLIRNGENGRLVPINDSESLVSAMVEIADNDNFASKLKENNCKMISKFSIDKITKMWLSFINKILVKDK